MPDKRPKTTREKVAAMNADGWSTSEIAYRLKCSTQNVHYHLRRIAGDEVSRGRGAP